MQTQRVTQEHVGQSGSALETGKLNAVIQY